MNCYFFFKTYFASKSFNTLLTCMKQPPVDIPNTACMDAYRELLMHTHMHNSDPLWVNGWGLQWVGGLGGRIKGINGGSEESERG